MNCSIGLTLMQGLLVMFARRSDGAMLITSAGRCFRQPRGSRSYPMHNLFSRFVKDESGATAIEYGLIAAGIAVVIITAVKLVGTNLNEVFNTIAGKLAAAPPAA